MSLRPYQDACIAAIGEFVERGTRQLLVPLPVASGKTVIFSHLPSALNVTGQTIVLVHRDELARQAEEKMSRYNPGLRIEVEKADRRASPEADVIVASVQSIHRRLDRFNPERVGLVITDECHRSLGETYLKVYRHLGVLPGEPGFNPGRIHIGWTATPKRTDGAGLDKVFTAIPFQRSMLDLMQDGVKIPGHGLYTYLVDVEAYRVSTDVDIDDVSITKSDFAIEELSKKINTPERNALAVAKYLELGEGMQGIAFCANVQHSKDIAETFNRSGIPAAAVYGDLHPDLRQKAIEDYLQGKIRVLSNCQVFTEGTDLPPAAVNILCRMTTSTLLLTQVIGRTLRPYPSPEDYMVTLMRGEKAAFVKPKSVIIDLVDTCSNHRIAAIPSLFGLNPKFDLKGKSAIETVKEIAALQEKQPELDLGEAVSLEEVKQKVKAHHERIYILQAPRIPPEIRMVSKFGWVDSGPGRYRLRVDQKTNMFLERDHLGGYEIYKSSGGVRIRTGYERNLRWATRTAEKDVPLKEHSKLRTDFKWNRLPPSKKQTSWLWRNDPAIKGLYATKEAFDSYVRKQHRAGDQDFNRRALSLRIDSRMEARRRHA